MKLTRKADQVQSSEKERQKKKKLDHRLANFGDISRLLDLPQVRVVFRTVHPKTQHAAAKRLAVATAFFRVNESGVDTLTSGHESAQPGSHSVNGDCEGRMDIHALSQNHVRVDIWTFSTSAPGKQSASRMISHAHEDLKCVPELKVMHLREQNRQEVDTPGLDNQ